MLTEVWIFAAERKYRLCKLSRTASSNTYHVPLVSSGGRFFALSTRRVKQNILIRNHQALERKQATDKKQRNSHNLISRFQQMHREKKIMIMTSKSTTNTHLWKCWKKVLLIVPSIRQRPLDTFPSTGREVEIFVWILNKIQEPLIDHASRISFPQSIWLRKYNHWQTLSTTATLGTEESGRCGVTVMRTPLFFGKYLTCLLCRVHTYCSL